MAIAEDIRALIEPLVTSQGGEVVDVEQAPGILRIYLDRSDGTGIDLDTITTFSEQISDLLDLHEDLVPGRYTLEVSSPGLERPLKTKEHFQRFVGTPVNVKTKPHVEGERRFSGTLIEATDTHVTVADRTLAYDDIDKARTIFAWGPSGPQSGKKRGPTPKPGKSRKATTS